jgi:RimJ/RimL family protein N-acetyltransferase
MITMERTTDRALIESVVLHPQVRHEVANDPEVGIVFHEHIYWLLARLGGVLIGLVVFLPVYGEAYNSHIAILPEYQKGGNGTEVMRLGVQWIFENTPCTKILAFPFKPAMIRIYQKCGFDTEGFSRKLISFHGVLQDCLIVGMTK